MLLVGYCWITWPDPPIYAQRLDALVDHPERFVDIKTRVSGHFIVGSCTRIATPCEYRFQIRDDHERTVNVRARQCALPDTDDLDPEVNLTLEGHMARDGSYFDASAVLVRVTRKYELPPSPPPPRRSFCPGP
jgi:cytochrome c-type biogenesis protein CcmE